MGTPRIGCSSSKQTRGNISTCGLWNKLLEVLEGVASQDMRAEEGRARDIDVRKWTAATDGAKTGNICKHRPGKQEQYAVY